MLIFYRIRIVTGKLKKLNKYKNIIMTEKENIKNELADLKLKLKELEEKEKNIGKSVAIKKLEEYTDDEKIKFFNKLYKSASIELDELEKNGYGDEDNAHYAWEEYITILAKDNKEFWKYWNSLDK